MRRRRRRRVKPNGAEPDERRKRKRKSLPGTRYTPINNYHPRTQQGMIYGRRNYIINKIQLTPANRRT